MFDLLTDPNAWAALATLTVMEIVLGIDNVVFISILVSRLPASRARIARQIGLGLALAFRIAFLFGLTWLMGLTATLFDVLGEPVTWRDLILLGGGLFLLVKGTMEIHRGIEGDDHGAATAVNAAFAVIVAQIIVIDLIFSVDSIITAIGMAQHIEIMITAVVIAVAVMYLASGPVSEFIKHHPTTKMLALAFLLLIGVALIADGAGFHIPRGYIYFAMAFSAAVEFVNVMARRRQLAREQRY
ncbi:putative tellurium resistance membrane protein TerC [Tepidamorphus gemmatus]|uniref:Putative tellurium resistance membrane protein TerC n=1 Tax=Tepidamorphus gemmatus TaxID=747076 RepID=A0A4R3MJ16_9HYPH|nr:TerC family protein [Tepidamorphus gemmatus]TCT12522.1 putative tellurium resistance membrane protein TerC [Tepidamorphus gemmatus]